MAMPRRTSIHASASAKVPRIRTQAPTSNSVRSRRAANPLSFRLSGIQAPKSQSDQLARVGRTRPAAPTNDGPREHLVGQLRKLVVFHGGDGVGINLRQVRLRSTVGGVLAHGIGFLRAIVTTPTTRATMPHPRLPAELPLCRVHRSVLGEVLPYNAEVAQRTAPCIPS